MTWVAGTAAKGTWRVFHEDWLAVPRDCRSRFAWTLTVVWLSLCTTMLATALLLRGHHGERLAERESGLLLRVADAIPISPDMAVFLESPGNGVVILPLAVALAVTYARRRRPFEAVAVLAAPLLSAIVVGIGWAVWPRPRPDFIPDGLSSGSLSAFPSGHMAMALPVYGLLTWLWLRHSRSVSERMAATSLVAVFLGVVAACRIVLGAHWLSDLAAGLLIGAVWLTGLVVALRAALPCGSEPDTPARSATRPTS